MIDAAIGEPPVLDELRGDWRAKLERWAKAEWDLFLKHSWALRVVARPLMGPKQMAWLEAAMAALADTGLQDAARLEAVASLDRYVRGAALDASRRLQDGTDEWSLQWQSSLARYVTEAAEQGRYATLARMLGAEQPGAEPAEADQELDFGLARMLDGIAAFIALRRTPSV